jgi:hypothetical protein
LAFGLASVAVAQSPAIQYVEPIAISLNSGSAQFDAYGRRFSLTLTDNARVLQKLTGRRKAELAPYRLLRGALEGTPGSWVRLTESAAGIEGAIWDGHDLYAVTSYARVAAALTTPIAGAAPGQTVVYRLSDVRDALPRDFCALDGATSADATVTGLDQYTHIVQELETEIAFASVTRQLEISLIGDSALQAVEPDATAAMLARLNIVEGIFSEQLGLLILATDVRLMPAGADPFTATKGATLLDQLGTYRAANAEVRARGLAHLVTGKDLDGSTAGIAYVDTVCSAEKGVSLSQQSFGTTISALIMAHELGHNLGASHDGEAGTPCASVGGGFIMAPSVSGFATFSSCSLAVMKATIEAASCVTPAEFADVAIEASTNKVTGEGGLPFTLPFVVKSNGNLAALNVVATITLPALAGYSIESASSSVGGCAVTGLTATCALGTMASADRHSITVNARGSSAQNFTAQARVTSSNDPVTSNNNRQLSVSIRSGVDAAVALSASAPDLALGAPIEIYADVSSLRALPLRNATLSVNFNQPVSQASMPGGVCTANTFSVSCAIADLPAGTTRRLTISATTTAAGPMFAGASINVSGEGDFSNNTANLTGWVRAEHDVELTAGPASVDLGVGVVYEIPYTLRSRGSGNSQNVALSITLLSGALAVDSIDAACTPSDAWTYQCDLGTLAPDATRVVRLRVYGIRAATADISAVAVSDADGYTTNNTAGVQLRIDHAVDLAVSMASGGAGIEDTRFDGQVTLRSNGKLTLTGATLDINLHAAGVLKRVAIHNGADCTLLDDQHARCPLPSMARNSQLFVDYQAEFAEPGTYDVTFTAVAAGDTAPDNNTLVRAVPVRPYNDIAITGGPDFTELVVGRTRAVTYTITTDRRSLASARFVAPHYLPGLRIAEIVASAGDCRVDADAGGICDFIDLPANSSVAVTVTYRAEQGALNYDVAASVMTTGDVSTRNDAVRTRVETHGATDLELRVGASVAGFRNATFMFPEISVVNGSDKAYATQLEVTLPPEVALVDVSAANAICSGSAVVRCDFSDLEAGSISTVSLTVRANAAGNFTSSLKLSASNDSNAANDTKDVALQVSNASSASASTKSGGGGGSFEWLSLVGLALLVAGKWRRGAHPRVSQKMVRLLAE